MRLWQKLTAGAALSAALLGTGIFSASLTANAAGGTVTLDTSGKLTLSGELTKEQIWAYRDNPDVKCIYADYGTVLPADCSWLFVGDEVLNAEEVEQGTASPKWAHHWPNLTMINLSPADTSQVRNMEGMFADLPQLTKLIISGIDTSNVTNMWGTFAGLTELETLDLSGFDTSKVTTMRRMFSGCSKVKELEVSGFDTSNVTDMSGLFMDCSKIVSLDVAGFNTEKVTDMSGMFRDCFSLVSLDVSGFDTSNVTYMSFMFCDNPLTELDLSSFDTSNVKMMNYMFFSCRNLTALDLSSFDTAKVLNTEWMFSGCENLKTVTVSDRWNMDRVADSAEMFSGCSNLKGGNGTSYSSLYPDKEYARIDRPDQPGYFTRGMIPLSAANVTLTQSSFPYTGKEVKIGTSIRVKYNGKALKYGTDFTLSYKDNIQCGLKTAKVTVKGIGLYGGAVTKTYTITPAKAAAPKLSTQNGMLRVEWAAVANAQGYQVQYCKDASFTGATLHSASFASSTGCNLKTYPKAGETWYVRVRAYIKDAGGTKYGTYSSAASTIVGRIGSVSLSKTDFAYTGKEVKVGNYISVRSGDAKLKYGTDFTLTYKNNIKAGTASVTVKGIGDYAGSVTYSYFINAS